MTHSPAGLRRTSDLRRRTWLLIGLAIPATAVAIGAGPVAANAQGSASGGQSTNAATPAPTVTPAPSTTPAPTATPAPEPTRH
ncbi:MAG: hypothetical protein QOD41_1174 [Cryptosporangiaceae bacterium]|nr:hypothetical protein [Cryptosporangiaceae bacterium]